LRVTIGNYYRWSTILLLPSNVFRSHYNCNDTVLSFEDIRRNTNDRPNIMPRATVRRQRLPCGWLTLSHWNARGPPARNSVSVGSDCITAGYSCLLCNVRVAALVRGGGARYTYKMVLREPPAAVATAGTTVHHALPPPGPPACSLRTVGRRTTL